MKYILMDSETLDFMYMDAKSDLDMTKYDLVVMDSYESDVVINKYRIHAMNTEDGVFRWTKIVYAPTEEIANNFFKMLYVDDEIYDTKEESF